MRVALDVRETSHMSFGMVAYVRKLRAWLPEVAPDVTLVAVGAGDNFDLAEQVGLPLEVVRARAALAHVPTPFVPRFLPGPYVVTVHDLIDLRFPQYAKGKVGAYYRAVVGPVLRAARCVITDDASTVAELASYLRVEPRRVAVIPLGDDGAPGEPRPPVGRPYLLYVANRRPHKNLLTLLDAWCALPPELEADLVLTGEPDPAFPSRGPSGELRFLGNADDAVLRACYAGAAAYVHPALREGFGLPLLEAMRAGVPVVAARPSLPAILAPHALAFDALDAGALRALLAALLADPAAARARGLAGRDATLAYTWERTARLTADVYRSAVA